MISNLGINKQALAVLHLLEWMIDEDDFVTSGAYYNGRERGIWINKNGKNAICYEHRNSDTIILHLFDGIFTNPPTYDQIPNFKSKWDCTHALEPGSISAAANIICEYINSGEPKE